MENLAIVYVVSDSLGETAHRVARAAVSQFDKPVEFRRVSYTVSKDAIEQVVREVDNKRALIVHTLVIPEHREFMNEKCRVAGIRFVDVMGPMMEELSSILQSPPKLQPGLIYQMDEDYFREVEAVEFAVKYDDGKDPRGLLKADIVLIGVSRTSKTPLSMYLAHRGYRVANIPLVPEVTPPDELFLVSPEKIFGLTIKPETLQSIRQERLKALGLASNASYASVDRINEELYYASSITNKIGCRIIDVTQRAVEETAAKVL
ncbi:MAG: pyruvate, water dikinase regulatory protein, partial [bacterium]|nr:pyruvate, water dikinase regulatory protein [bacterium]